MLVSITCIGWRHAVIAGVLHLVGSFQVQQWQCCVWSALHEHAQGFVNSQG